MIFNTSFTIIIYKLKQLIGLICFIAFQLMKGFR